MKAPRDNFSSQADTYAVFRPTYPAALYDFIFSHVANFDTAWDCGTGNGQVAEVLSHRFKKVYGTDISAGQLEHAPKKDNIFYKTERAELTSFSANTFDLITAAQALHWFDPIPFYKEATRLAKDGGIIAAWGYNLVKVNPQIDSIIKDFYHHKVGSFWDAERKYVDSEYKTILFPFDEIAAPRFEIKAEWTLDQLLGYLSSWSSVQHYISHNGINPVLLIEKELEAYWETGTQKTVTFPLFIRIGKISK